MSRVRMDRMHAAALSVEVCLAVGFGAFSHAAMAAEALPVPQDDPVLLDWAQACTASRPGLPPLATRSPGAGGVAGAPAGAELAVAEDPVANRLLDATLALLDEYVVTPPPDAAQAVPHAVASGDDNVVYAVTYVASDGSTQEFAAHFRPDDDRPLYWYASGYPSTPSATFDDARTALVARALGGSTDGLRVLGYGRVADASTVALRRADGTPVSPPWPRCWLFFVDDHPTSGWEHPCRYIFIAEDLSSLAVQYVRQPLALNDLTQSGHPDLFMELLVAHPAVDAPHVPTIPSGAVPLSVAPLLDPVPLDVNLEGSAQNCYAVIISGGIEARQNYIRYWEDSANIYSTLTRKYGFRDDHIIALVSDGTDAANDRNSGNYDFPSYSNSPTDLDNDGDVDVDGPATFAEVQAAFTDLAGILTSNDQLFVFVTDHGSQQSGWDAWVCLWGWTWLRDDQLRDMTDNLLCPVFFALETCYSGGFVDDIAEDANRVIGAACAFDDTSEGWWHFDPWVYYLTGAFRGFYPASESAPWNDGDVCNVDPNADHRVSFREAYDHAWNHKPDSDIPQLGENPVGLADSLYLQHFHVELGENSPATYSQITKDFSFGVLANDWAAVGIAPSTDHDIEIDDNRTFGSVNKTSTYGSTARDFIVFSGTALPGYDTLYARVYFGTPSSYVIEAEWNNTDLTIGSAANYTANSGEVFDLCEVTLTAGVSYEVVVDISSGTPDLSVFLFRPSQTIANRLEAFKTVNVAGAGGDETVAAFVAPESGSYAIMVVNENAGVGIYGVTPRTATPLATPAGVAASDGAHVDRIRVTWSGVAGATHYRVYRNTVNDSGTAVAVNSWTAGTSYDDTIATAGRVYYYWVKAAAGSDGLRQSAFSGSNDGYVDPVALVSDVRTNANYTAYYKCRETADFWWAVGVRVIVPSTPWDLRLYDSPGFVAQSTLSLNGSPVNFVVVDGTHLANTYHGVRVDPGTLNSTAAVEFESGGESLSIGSTSLAWPSNDVVKVWNVNLAASTTYRFTLDITSGVADLGIALFGSQDAAYYKSRFQYLAHSESGVPGADETFTYTTPAGSSDSYGFCVWNDRANGANYTLTIETLANGLWEGDVSTDWHTAGNWNDGFVPDASDDVTIPGGCPRYPAITTANASCRDLSVQSGASLTLTPTVNRWLYVNGNLSVAGTLSVNNFGKPYLYGDVAWETGAVLSDSGFVEMYVNGDWDVQDGTDVALADGNIYFPGSEESWIRIWDATAAFHRIICQKTGGQRVGFSAVSVQPLRASRINVDATAAFRSYSYQSVILADSLYNNGGHFSFDYGPLVFDGGTPTYALAPNIGDHLQNLVMSSTGTLALQGTYTNSLVIHGDVVIESGVLDANGVDMEVGGNWDNQVGLAAFRPDDNEVYFFSADPVWVWGDTRFCDFRDELMDDPLTIVGNVVVTNWCEVMMHLIVQGSLDVDGELDLQESTASLEVPAGGTVAATLFDMGGTLLVSGGTFACDDLADAGIDGIVTVSAGTATLTQGTGAGEWIDLLGDVTVSGGTLRIVGGASGASWWPYDQNASLAVSAGLLDVPNADVRVYATGAVTWSSTLSGGVMRFGKSLQIDRSDFLPTGGTCEFTGSTSAVLLHHGDSRLHNVVVDKTGATLTANTDLDIRGDLAIRSGTLGAPALLEIMGSWSNGVGAAGFAEGTGVVRFHGDSISRLQSDETFYDLTLDKTYAGVQGLELMGVTAQVGRDLALADGTLEMNDGSILDVGRHVAIASGAALNANDAGSIELYVGGNWSDLNTSFGSSVGFDPGYDSRVTFDGSSVNGTLATAAPEATFNLVTINRPEGYLTLLDSATVRDDLHIVSGGWWYSGGPYTNRLRGDFIVESAGAWYDQVSALVFDGTTVQNLDYRGVEGWLQHLVVEKNTGIGVFPLVLLSDVHLLNNGSLTVREGYMDLNGHFMHGTGDVTVENGGKLWIDEGACVAVGADYAFEVQSGGLLDVRGTAGNPARITHDYGNYSLTFLSGSQLLAENAVFEYMDANGLKLDLGATLVEPFTFHGCTFGYGVSGGTLLKLLTTQSFTVRKAAFPSNPGGGASNVHKASRGGTADFVAASGTFAGEPYDNDSLGLVTWHTGALGGLTLDVPAVATMGVSYAADATVSASLPLTPITYRWTITDLSPQSHAHDNLTDTRADCSWVTAGNKLVSVSASNELGVVQSQASVDVQVLTVDYAGRHWVGTTNAVDLVILGTSAESTYRVQFRPTLTDGDWTDAAPGGLAVPGQDGNTPWADLGGPERDVTTAPRLFYRAMVVP